MLLRALLQTPGLPLRVLTGEEALDRPVRGVFTTDLLDPRRYLSGGELVLSGLMWWRSPADSEVFVSALAQSGVIALAAGDAALGSIPPDLVDACRRHGLPLLEVPVNVSFAAITERVMWGRLHDPGILPAGGGQWLLRNLGAGSGALGGGEPTAETVGTIFAAAGAQYGLAGWLLSPTGRLVADSGTSTPQSRRATLATGYLTASRLPATVIADGGLFSLFAVNDRPVHRLASWFVAFAGDYTAWDTERQALGAALTDLAAAHWERCELERAAASEAAEDLLRRLLADGSGAFPAGRDGTIPTASLGAQRGSGRGTAGNQTPGVVAALRRLGLVRGGPVAVIAAALSGVAEPGPLARALLAEMVPGAAVAMCDGEAVAFATGAQDVTGRVRAAGRALRTGLAGVDVSIGVSVAGRLSRAVEEARQAARIAAMHGTGVNVVDAAQLGSCEVLVGSAPTAARLAFQERALAPLIAYDRRHGSELVRTLEVFLGCSGSWTKAASQMFVHVNSLRYRVRRIEELTGRDLGSLADQADLLLALRLRKSAAAEQ